MSHPKSYWLKEARLSRGSHQPNGEACVMEAASQLLKEQWTDHPLGVDPQIAAFCRAVNDRFGDDVRAELQKRLPRIIKAKHLPDEYRFRWAEFGRQEAIRAFGPVKGAMLAALPPIIDKAAAYAASAAYAAATNAAAAYAASAFDAAAAAGTRCIAELDRALDEATP